MADEKEKTGQDFGLNLKQSKFCELYATSEEFFAHGTKSYLMAYPGKTGEPTSLKTAESCASRMLSNVKILEYINYLLELGGLNNTFVDKQLEFLITQNTDFKTKLGGIKEFNQLKSRIVKKVDLTTGGQPFDNEQKDTGKKAVTKFLGGDTG